MLDALVGATFGMAPAARAALSDDDWIDLAGQALYLKQRREANLEVIITNAICAAFKES